MTFLPALGGGFIWDDFDLVVQNKHVKDFSQLGHNLTSSFWQVSASEPEPSQLGNLYYRPVVTLSLMVDHALFGLAPWGYHLTNLLLHLMVVFLVYLVSRRLLEGELGALVATLVFAVHPTRAEVAAWISGRSDSMMALFFLCSLLLFWRALENPRRRALVTMAAWALYVLAVFSKESAVALALVVPALDWLVVSRGERRRFMLNLRWCHLPVVGTTLVFLAARLWYQEQLITARGGGILDRVWLVTQSLAHYFLSLVNPYRPSMQIGAEFNQQGPSWDLVVLGLVLFLAWCLALWRGGRRHHLVAFGLLFLGLTLAPVSNIVPLRLREMVAERFLYLPWLGGALLLGLAVRWAARWRTTRVVSLVGVAVLTSSWAVAAHRRSAEFEDSVRFWSAELRANPDSPRAMESLAETLVEQRRLREAEDLFLRAYLRSAKLGRERARPMNALLRLLDVHLLQTTDLEVPFLEATERFVSRLLELAAPPGGKAVLALEGGTFEIEVGDKRMREVVQKSRSHLLTLLGTVQGRLGRDDDASRALRQALALDPRRTGVLLNLALVRLRALDIDGATQLVGRLSQEDPKSPWLPELRRAIQTAAPRVRALRGLVRGDPARSEDPQVHRLLAEVYILTRAPGRACRHLRQVIALRPDDPGARSMLALELAASGRLEDALKVLAEARRRFGESPQLRALEQDVRRVAAQSRKPR